MISYSDKVNRSYQVSKELDRIFKETCKLEGFDKSDIIRMLIEGYIWVIRTQPELKDAPLKFRVIEALKNTRVDWGNERPNSGWFQKTFNWR